MFVQSNSTKNQPILTVCFLFFQNWFRYQRRKVYEREQEERRQERRRERRNNGWWVEESSSEEETDEEEENGSSAGTSAGNGGSNTGESMSTMLDQINQAITGEIAHVDAAIANRINSGIAAGGSSGNAAVKVEAVKQEIL